MSRKKIQMIDYLLEEQLKEEYPSAHTLYEDRPDPPFDYIEETTIDYDADKNTIDKRLILKRESDDKFFEVCYTQYSYMGTSIKDEVGEEVFPKQIITTVYE